MLTALSDALQIARSMDAQEMQHRDDKMDRNAFHRALVSALSDPYTISGRATAENLKKLAKKILLKKKKKKMKRRRAEAEAAAGDEEVRAAMGFGGFGSTAGESVDDNRTGAARGGARARRDGSADV